MRWLLVVAALALGGCEIRSGESGQSSSRYTMVADEQGGVWRMDTQYGTLDRCTFGGDSQVHCVRASR